MIGMDAIERTARETGTYESTLTYLAELVDADYLTDEEFRTHVRRELGRNRSRIAELRAEPAAVTRMPVGSKKRPPTSPE